MFNHAHPADLKPSGCLHLAELARKAEVTPATDRYYSRVGLLTPSREPENGYRCFTAMDLRRIEFIRQAQALGLTIGDIKAVLELVDHSEDPSVKARLLVKKRLVGVQEKLLQLQATKCEYDNCDCTQASVTMALT